MILKRLATDADLAASSYEAATKDLVDPILRIPPELVIIAWDLGYPFEVDLRLPGQCWYVVDKYGGRFSVGA